MIFGRIEMINLERVKDRDCGYGIYVTSLFKHASSIFITIGCCGELCFFGMGSIGQAFGHELDLVG